MKNVIKIEETFTDLNIREATNKEKKCKWRGFKMIRKEKWERSIKKKETKKKKIQRKTVRKR